MPKILLTYKYNSELEVYKRFFKYTSSKYLYSKRNKIIVFVGLIILATGILLKSILLISVSAIYLILISFYLAVYVIKLWNIKRNVNANVEKFKHLDGTDLTFIFNDEIIGQDFDGIQFHVKWEKVKYYELNASDIYLYFEKRELFQIISLDLIDERNYADLLHIIKEKVQKIP